MATLTVQTASLDGITPTYNSAAGGGDAFSNSGDIYIHVKNGDVASKTVTVVSQKTVKGLAVADVAVAVAAGEEAIIGPFPTDIFNDSNGLAQLTYSAVTSVTLAVIQIKY